VDDPEIKPDPQDYEAIEREYGRLPPNASVAQRADHYRLAQANKLIRLYEQGRLPLAAMRALDALAKKKDED
jgi:hypothetical protein